MKQYQLDKLIWITAFTLANFRGMVISDVLRQASRLTVWVEILIWLILVGVILLILRSEDRLREYKEFWVNFWILIVFTAFVVISVFWSVSSLVSIYRIASFLFASLIGVYIGMRYSLSEVLSNLFRFGAVLLIVCFVVSLLLPGMGVMNWEPYNGAWRGIFWHKNHLGSILALFNLVFLIKGLDGVEKKNKDALMYLVFYIASLAVIFLSKSVAGYMLVISLSFLTLLSFAWLRFRSFLKPAHYYVFIFFIVLVLTIIFTNLDFILGMFNRDTSLTGRVPLWIYLVRNVIAESPWFGYGFGALWSLDSFRSGLQHVLGWKYPVVIADNGFLDILLYVGMIGFIPFLIIMVTGFVKSASHFLDNRSILNVFPLMFMMYLVISNISYSLILETETFTWLVLVIILYLTSMRDKSIS